MQISMYVCACVCVVYALAERSPLLLRVLRNRSQSRGENASTYIGQSLPAIRRLDAYVRRRGLRDFRFRHFFIFFQKSKKAKTRTHVDM